MNNRERAELLARELEQTSLIGISAFEPRRSIALAVITAALDAVRNQAIEEVIGIVKNYRGRTDIPANLIGMLIESDICVHALKSREVRG